MKKTFVSVLRTMCVGAMTLFAVSCYDDSALNEKLTGLSDDLKAVQEKLAELESDLNEQVAALATLNTQVAALEGKVAAIKVETTEAGLTTVTLADGSKVVVSANGVVTIVTEDGKDYWAVVDKDGKVTNLGIAVGHELTFEVDPATGELMVNGEGTGAYVTVESAYVLGGVVETEDSVTITVGDKTYTLAKKSPTEFEIVSGKVYFNPLESKTLSFVVEGVKSTLVASYPKNWTVSVEGTTLTITAPKAAEDDWGDLVVDGDASGVVEIWVLTVDGTVLNGKVAVAITSSPAVVEYNALKGIASFKFDFSSDDWSDAAYYGACAANEFDVEAIKAEIKAVNMGKESKVFTTYDDELGNNVTTATHSLEELLGYKPVGGTQYIIWTVSTEVELVRDPNAPAWDWNAEIIDAIVTVKEEDFAKNYIDYYEINVEATTSWKGVELNVSTPGLDEYFLAYYDGSAVQNTPFEFFFSQEMLDNWDFMFPNDTFYDFLLYGGSMIDSWSGETSFLQVTYGNTYSADYVGALDGVCEYYTPTFQPGSDVTMLIMPIIPGKETSTYCFSDILVYNYKLNDIELVGGSATVELSDPANISQNSFEVPYTAQNAERVYYGIISKEAYEEWFEGAEGADFVEAAIDAYFTLPVNDASDVLAPAYHDGFGCIIDTNYEPVGPGSDYVVYAFAVDAAGKCGAVDVVEVSTKAIVIVDAEVLSASKGVVTVEPELATWTFDVVGTPVNVYYNKNFCDVSKEDHTDDSAAVKAQFTDEVAQIKLALDPNDANATWLVKEVGPNDIVDGKITLSADLGNGRTYMFRVMLEDAEGRFSHITFSDTFYDESQRPQ